MPCFAPALNRRPAGREMQFSGGNRRAASVLKVFRALRTPGKPALKKSAGIYSYYRRQIKKALLDSSNSAFRSGTLCLMSPRSPPQKSGCNRTRTHVKERNTARQPSIYPSGAQKHRNGAYFLQFSALLSNAPFLRNPNKSLSLEAAEPAR